MFSRMRDLSMVVDDVVWVCLNRMHIELCSSQEHLPRTGSRRTWIAHCLNQSGAELIMSAVFNVSSEWCWRSWLSEIHESSSSLFGRPTLELLDEGCWLVFWEVLLYRPGLMTYVICYPRRWTTLLPWCRVNGPELSGMCFVAQYDPDVSFALWSPRCSVVRMTRRGMRG